jgi:GH15 family glucan-1,4-alpha-glucosidase
LYEDRGFDDYTVGLFDIEGKQGSFRDAGDGHLSRNAVEHGSVDSVVGVHMRLTAFGDSHLYYWIVAADSITKAHKLHGDVLTETPERLMESTERYWSAWADGSTDTLSAVSAPLRELYRHSLGVIAHHADHGGGIVASSDTEILNQGRDTYGYVWPRDSAFVALALSRGGYRELAERFFTFISKLIEPSGYLMHKYRVDGVLGSSWHPWVRDGMMELPIQEDETALVLYALGEHYALFPDIAFIESLYNPFIEPAANFISGYMDAGTELPQSSYDLWEEKYGISTFTASAVFAALSSASMFATLLGKRDAALRYRRKAEQVRMSIEKELYDPLSGTYLKLLRREKNGVLTKDHTLDMSSPHGVFLFGVVPPHEIRAHKAFEKTAHATKVPGSVGGYMRYEGDNYYRTGKDESPNPWCITTLWVAQHYIRIARSRDELEKAYEILEWVSNYASESGMLPEQLNPHTGAHLSTSPLLWSHAEFVNTVYFYQKKYRSLPH